MFILILRKIPREWKRIPFQNTTTLLFNNATLHLLFKCTCSDERIDKRLMGRSGGDAHAFELGIYHVHPALLDMEQ